MLGVAAVVALAVLAAMATLVLRRQRTQLRALHRLAADGLLGQARARVPQPIAGSEFEALVAWLDRGDHERARVAYRRMLAGLGRPRPTGWHAIAAVASALPLAPLAPALLASLGAVLGSGPGPRSCGRGSARARC